MHLLSNAYILLLLSYMMWDLLTNSDWLWIADESLEDALKQLNLIDAIDENGSITSVGQTMASTFIPLTNCPLLNPWVLKSNGLLFRKKNIVAIFLVCFKPIILVRLFLLTIWILSLVICCVIMLSSLNIIHFRRFHWLFSMVLCRTSIRDLTFKNLNGGKWEWLLVSGIDCGCYVISRNLITSWSKVDSNAKRMRWFFIWQCWLFFFLLW